MELQCLVQGVLMAGDHSLSFPGLATAAIEALDEAAATADLSAKNLESHPNSLAFIEASKMRYISRLLALHLKLGVSLLERRQGWGNGPYLIYHGLYNEAHLAPPAVREAFESQAALCL
jgi:hypothetical protein